jgi:hypothetical protein
MGLFNFSSGPKCEVTITSIEKQDPSEAVFPVTDSVIKGQFTVRGLADCTVLSHRITVSAASPGTLIVSGRRIDQEFVLADETHDKTTEIIGMDYRWPYKLKKEDEREDGFCLIDFSIEEKMISQYREYPSVKAMLDDPDLYFFIKIRIQISGEKEPVETAVRFTVVSQQ